MPWIKEKILKNCKVHDSIFDVFGGTGVVTANLLDISSSNIINDFLYSNEVIYRAFFEKGKYSKGKLLSYKEKYNSLNKEELKVNYVSENFGNKYFSLNDSKIIGYIREDIEKEYGLKKINKREYYILITSLLYSFDRCANTVGHYEAYIKGKNIKDNFLFDLVEPIKTTNTIKIYREDSNELAKKLSADVAFIDPPYNSRQYSRFYHVMETITKWDKPKLVGTAMKPPEENMSNYCRNNAPQVFQELIENLKVKYIVVTYNNTYNSKSTSSKNKITLEEIENILKNKGETKIFTHKYNAFNAGKTDLKDHQEYLFITEVKNG